MFSNVELYINVLLSMMMITKIIIGKKRQKKQVRRSTFTPINHHMNRKNQFESNIEQDIIAFFFYQFDYLVMMIYRSTKIYYSKKK